MPPRIVEVREKILKKNDELARAMRDEFARCGVFVTNLVSGPGAGKTELLKHTLTGAAARPIAPLPSSAIWRRKTTPNRLAHERLAGAADSHRHDVPSRSRHGPQRSA